MSKQELLEECISLAYKINKFGDFIFVNIWPHVKLTSFIIYEDGNRKGGADLYLSIYEDQNYGEFKHNYENNQPNNIEELHIYLINLLKEKVSGADE